LARVHLISSHWAAQAEALEHALDHARRAEDRREQVMILGELARALHFGPMPVRQAIERCEQMLEETGRDRTLEASVFVDLADLEAMRGRFDHARSLYWQSRDILSDLGLRPLLAAHTIVLASIENLAGDPGAAEEELRFGVETFEELGVPSSLATLRAFLARTSLAQGRLEEAGDLVERVRSSSSSDAPFAYVLGMATHARVLAAKGDLGEAERSAREAVEFAAQTDTLNLHADALVALAHVLAAAHDGETDQVLADAIRLYARKGNEVAQRRAEQLREALVLDAQPGR
jgi:ATP/maltotriose-dependent transcriptional regulator MalT